MTTRFAALVVLQGAWPGLGYLASNAAASPRDWAENGPFANASPEELEEAGRVVQGHLDEVAEMISKRFHCTISLAIKSSNGNKAAAFNNGRPSDTSNEYAFGSITKLITGASVMKLVSEGRLNLEDKVAPIVDPFIARMATSNKRIPFRSINDLWGRNGRSMNIRNLLTMTTGFPDFDTAEPCDPHLPFCVQRDRLRQSLFKYPSHDFPPAELLNKSWVKDHWRHCFRLRKDTHRFCYSSTNFILLGMVLAEKTGASTWQALDQSAFLPAKYKDQIRFVKHGTPRQNGLAPGFDRTVYNLPKGHTQNRSVHNVAGVFSGWAGSNAVGAALPLAKLIYDIYGPGSEVLPDYVVRQMTPGQGDWYGLATHNVGSGGMDSVSQGGKYGRAYGHFGATYGYQSVVAYFPTLDLSIAVLSDVETMTQDQASMAMCLLYNRIAGFMLGRRIVCEGRTGEYYGPSCNCTQIQRRVDPATRRAPSPYTINPGGHSSR